MSTIQQRQVIGLFGGAFDPVHLGHLRVAIEVYQQLQLHELRFVPYAAAVLGKKLFASPAQRTAMLRLAIDRLPGFSIDARELQRATPSYTIETLRSVRAELPAAALCWIVGYDALLNLEQWQHWQSLLDYAHFIVVTRPDYVLPATGMLTELIAQHGTIDAKVLQTTMCGAIYFMPCTPLAISSTLLRAQLAQGLSARFLTPTAVCDFIAAEQLYR